MWALMSLAEREHAEVSFLAGYRAAIQQERSRYEGLLASVASRLGAVYDHALVLAIATAREHGYAIGRHGSELRDLDLMAVPWTQEAVSPGVLAEAIRKAVGGTFSVGTQTGEVMSVMPRGRLAWAIHLEGIDVALLDALAAGPRPFSPYIDLSVMPPAVLTPSAPAEETDRGS